LLALATRPVQRLRRFTAMDLMVADGLFAALSGGFVAFMTPFLLALGATRGHISILTSLQTLTGNVLQLPFARLTESIGQRKRLCVLAGAAARCFWVGILLIPFLVRGPAAVYAVMGLMVMMSVCGALAGPAWTSIMAGLVPRELRGRFFSTKNVVTSLGTLVSLPVASRLIATGGFPAGYQWGIAVSLALGLVAFAFFLRIPEPPYQPPGRRPLILRSARAGWRDTWSVTFLRYVAATTTMGLAAGIAGPFCAVYGVQELGASVVHLGYYSMAGTVSGLLCQKLWGRVADRRGPRLVMVIAGFAVALSSLLWFYAPTVWHPIAAEVVGGVAWGAWGLAAFNLLLEVTPDDRRPSHVAVHSMVTGMAATVAPLVGLALIGWVGFRQIFLVSTILRLLAAELLRRSVR
jgi:MFS family permease